MKTFDFPELEIVRYSEPDILTLSEEEEEGGEGGF